ncbi:MAG: CopG family antitoxin [Acidobacteriota bacterium]
MPGKADRPKVPKFETEAEEAKWWDEHRALVEQELSKAMRDGTAQKGTAQRLTRQWRASKNITIRMPLDDVERARRLADRKGLGYQTYMKMLLHEALNREESGSEKPPARRKTG